MAEKKAKGGAVYVLTGVCMAVLCAAVSVAALIVPYEKAQTYLGIAFMDSKQYDNSTGLSGLVIKDSDDIPTDPGSAALTEDPTVVRPSFGEQYAVLRCEAAKMEVPVYWGSSPELLERGACQSSASSVIGVTGNAVIDAHVNTFFANLMDIQPGDEVVAYTRYGVFTYQARELVEFENTDKKYVGTTETDQLTLYTCKAQVLGTSTTRVGVLCDLVSKQFYVTGEEAAE